MLHKWIKVHEGLPKDSCEVIVLDDDRGYMIDRFDRSSGWQRCCEVIAWSEFEGYYRDLEEYTEERKCSEGPIEVLHNKDGIFMTLDSIDPLHSINRFSITVCPFCLER